MNFVDSSLCKILTSRIRTTSLQGTIGMTPVLLHCTYNFVMKSLMFSFKFVKGHLSDRMRLSDNVWVETWQSATPLPAYRQKRIFDDTKEAEKVLHFFASLRLSELAMALMPLLLHSAALRLRQRLRTQPLARAEGILQDALLLLATVQQPSLDSLPLYQVAPRIPEF